MTSGSPHASDIPIVDQVMAGNQTWQTSGQGQGLDQLPSKSVAVVTCMDARVDAPAAFGLARGEAHVIRNAGAMVTEDVLRSLLLSQYALGTTAVLVIGHTDCGVQGHDQEATAAAIESERGARPAMELGSMTSVRDEVRAGVQRLRTSPTLRHRDQIHGFVYDVATGALISVDIDAPESVDTGAAEHD